MVQKKIKNNSLEKVILFVNIIVGFMWIFIAINYPKPFNYWVSVLWVGMIVLWIYWFWKKRRKLTRKV